MEQMDKEIKDNQAHVSIQKPLPQVIGNFTTLVQIITNLISNGIKFVSPDVKPEIRIWADILDTRVRLWVEDNGIGIDPDNQDKIYHVFERLHGTEEYSGTGIGLAIVSRGIQRLGGNSGVESQPKKGSRFWVELRK